MVYGLFMKESEKNGLFIAGKLKMLEVRLKIECSRTNELRDKFSDGATKKRRGEQ